jgi:hypothetical protein
MRSKCIESTRVVLLDYLERRIERNGRREGPSPPKEGTWRNPYAT